MKTAAEGAIDLNKLRRVLIIKPSSLGDIVHTLPSLHDLKTRFPHLEITWLANTEWLPLLKDHPQLKETLEFPRQRLRGLGGALPAIRWMLDLHRKIQPDVALDYQGLFRSGLMAWFSHSRRRVGLSDAREWAHRFHQYQVEVEPSQHAVDRYRCLGAALGADTSAPAVFSLPKGEALSRPLPENVVALHPFSRGDGKSLTHAQIEQFCQIVERPIVLLGRLEPEKRAQLRLPDHVIDLLNETTLPQLITCLRQARRVISVDSGPMHLAAALQPERTLGIHTWSDPRKVGPYANASWVWKAGKLAHRDDLTAEDCTQKTTFTDADVSTIAQWAEG